MSEEEKVEWAKQHNLKSRIWNRGHSQASVGKKKILHREEVRAHLKKLHSNDETKKKYWGQKRREREWYLYNYNEEYRQAYLYRKAIAALRNNPKVSGWVNDYYNKIKPNLESYAQTFKNVGIYEDFSYGFRLKDLAKVLPIHEATLTKFIDREIFPPMVRKGYMFKGLKIQDKVSDFYTLEEVEAICQIWVKFWIKYKNLGNGRDLYIKKKLWTALKEIRDGKKS